MSLGEELLKTIQVMINKNLRNYKADHTYRTTIKRIDKNGYVITDEAGNERTAPMWYSECRIKTDAECLCKRTAWKFEGIAYLRRSRKHK